MRYLLALFLLSSCASSSLWEGLVQERWGPEQMPVAVSVSEDFRYPDAVAYAVKVWNETAGCPLLEYRSDGAKIHVETDPEYPRCVQKGAKAVATLDNRVIVCHSLDNPREVMVHELGHMLGLDHDIIQGSIMNEVIPEDAEIQPITQYLVQASYCHQNS